MKKMTPSLFRTMRMTQVTCAMALSLAAANVAAVNWDHVGVGYVDHFGSGAYLNLSHQLEPRWVVRADLERVSKHSVDVSEFSLGANYLTEFKLDFAPSIQTYVRGGLQHAFEDASDTGVYAGVGITDKLTPEVEWFTELSYHSIGRDYTSFAGGIAFYFSPEWAARTSVALNSGNRSNEFRLGVSYQF
ncbi:hypothetical protein [Alkalimonas sp.]|uniref:hypothetical protein n=1 Tax=Alkalimonas sp. TaxID=1872453 RepID=UPI00263B1B59|nr:hypothetical protein [Alkalimonas sp.]